MTDEEDFAIEREDFFIRPAQEHDKPGCVECFQNWEIVRWLEVVPYPYADKDADEWFARAFIADRKNHPFFRIIAEKKSNRIIGAVSLREEEGKRVLGYWLDQPYWGRGIMSWAATSMIRWGQKKYPTQEIIANANPENHASRRVLEKAGFEHHGMHPRQKSALRGPEQNCLYRLKK